jgi:hypothetical protein
MRSEQPSLAGALHVREVVALTFRQRTEIPSCMIEM